MIHNRPTLPTVLFVLVSMVISACTPIQTAVTKQTELQFITHVAAALPEQDVYVANEDGMVYRVSAEETEQYLDAPLYSVAAINKHDPFLLGENPFGPYDAGTGLGFDMQNWLAGTGSATYAIRNDIVDLDMQFQKLIPHATYTVWCNAVMLPPNFTIIDEPCGADDGSENAFVTDAEGNAIFQMHISPLAKSTSSTLRTIALAYHSDGNTYGNRPGAFGHNSHIQLFAIIPDVNSEAWQTSSSVMVASAR